MATVFSRIIAGELPGTFVWRDDDVVAFLSIAPLTAGHTLVVPRQEIDQWTDLPVDVMNRSFEAARAIGRAVRQAWGAPRAGLIVAGFEVPHAHLHVFPAWHMGHFDFTAAHPLDDPAELTEPAAKIRDALRQLGYGEHAAA